MPCRTVSRLPLPNGVRGRGGRPAAWQTSHAAVLVTTAGRLRGAQLARGWGAESIALHCDSSDPAMFRMYERRAPCA